MKNLINKSRPFYERLIFCVLFGLFFTNLNAQVPVIQWQKVLGGLGEDQNWAIQQTTDGGYVTAGYTTSSNSGDVGTNHGGMDFWVVKVNALGAIQWQKVLGGTGNERALGIQQTTDGGYIVAGTTTSSNSGDVASPNHGDQDAWIVKLDASGVIQWQKVLGGTAEERVHAVEKTADGGYIVSGSTTSSNSGDVGLNHGAYDAWVIKLSSVGTVQWQKTYGTASHEEAQDIKQTADGGYVFTGYTGLVAYWLVKLDALGTVQWEKSVTNIYNDKAASVQQTTDGGYIIAGLAGAGIYNSRVVKFDAVGTIQWDKSFGGNGDELGAVVQQTPDGGFAVLSLTTSSSSGDVGVSHGGWDYWLIKLSPLGIIVWQKLMGGSGTDEARAFRQTPDGGFIIVGNTNSSNTGDVGTNHGSFDTWLVKLAPPCPFTPSVTGNNFMYKGETLSLIGSATTGTAVWSSDNTSVATVSQTGVVTGVNSGTTTINYAVTEGNCTAVVSKLITVIFFDPTKCYRIANKVSSKVLAIKDASLADAAQIYQWTYDGRVDKLWKVVKLADGKYNFASVGSGKLMDIQDNTPAGFCVEGTITQQFTADGTSSQKWRLELQQTDGSFKIINETCNKFLRVEGPSSADGANVGIKNDFGTDAFKWFIEEMPCAAPIDPNQCYRIVNKATGKVLEIKDAALTDSTQIYQWTSAANRPQQLWKTTKLGDGKYIITSMMSSKVMDVLDNTAAGFCTEGTIIQQFPLDYTNSQRWGLIVQPDGSYKIVNATCNKYLRVESASTADGASVGIKNDFGSDAFKWYFQPADCFTGVAFSSTNATFGFEARASEGRAKLQWITNTGYKTDYFEIERMNAQGDFNVLGRQNAEVSKDMTSYTFTDNDPLDGDNLYRINSISQNGPPQYSEVKKVSFSKNDGINIFPNPVDEFINVDLRKYEGKTVSLSVYNSVGLLVKKQTIEKVSTAPQQIDVQGFGTGSYLLRVQSEGKREVTRLFHIAK